MSPLALPETGTLVHVFKDTPNLMPILPPQCKRGDARLVICQSWCYDFKILQLQRLQAGIANTFTLGYKITERGLKVWEPLV